MFMALSGEDPVQLYKDMVDSLDHRIAAGRWVYVGWNKYHLQRGNYHYGFSHTPIHTLSLPPRTFRFTCFRDPLERVVSHYRMLKDYEKQPSGNSALGNELSWLGQSFGDFLRRIPERHLLNQLYMFSSSMNLHEGLERARGLDYYFFNDDFSRGIDDLNGLLEISLQPIHARRSKSHVAVSEAEKQHLLKLLQPEYRFLHELRHGSEH